MIKVQQQTTIGTTTTVHDVGELLEENLVTKHDGFYRLRSEVQP